MKHNWRVAAMLGVVALALLAVACFFFWPVLEDNDRDAHSGAAGRDKLSIVATLFPQYDFARRIAGDKADVSLLLPPGSEAHMFDPRPADIRRIHEADLFIYTGDQMEPWAKKIIAGIESVSPVIVDASAGVKLLSAGEGKGADPHFWLDPTKAKIMVYDITRVLCVLDPGNSEFYARNAERLTKDLAELDDDTERMVRGAKRHTLVFGGHFAYRYFLARYKLDYVTVNDSFSSEAEPSATDVAGAITFIRKNKIPCIYYGELENASLAKSIASECGIVAELFDTAHNVSKKDIDAGVSFISIMRGNIARVRKGLY